MTEQPDFLILYLVAAFAVGLLAGALTMFALRRRDDGRRRRLEAELEQARARVLEKTREHENYKEQVGAHFQKTAELFHGLTAQYREVYLHLANSAQQLVGERPLALQADMEATERLIQSSPAAGEATEASRTGEAATERQPEPPPTARLRKEAKATGKENEEVVGDAPHVPDMEKTGTEDTGTEQQGNRA